MRLLGNKTRLLGDIQGFLLDRGVRGGTFIDIFSGTASVARHFKALGFRVIANDRLSMCHTKAVAEVEVSRYPVFERAIKEHAKVFRSKRFQGTFGVQSSLLPDDVRRDGQTLELVRVLHLLERHLQPEEGLVTRCFSPRGSAGRMYFTEGNAKHIDAVLGFLRRGFRSGFLDRAELYLILSSLLDAADRVANISGTYGAYLKTWQRNALEPLSLRLPEVLESPLEHQAFQEDANDLVREVKGDVLYIDPPYNHRQYPANYHVIEILAEHHRVEDLAAHEASLYGKTGLRPYGDLQSAYCVAPPPAAGVSFGRFGDALSAMADLVLSARVQHVLVSYNEEGILTREQLGGILALFSGDAAFDFARDMRSVSHRRFCSDSDREGSRGRVGRRYKVLEGRRRGEIVEWLLYASRTRSRKGARRRRSSQLAQVGS